MQMILPAPGNNFLVSFLIVDITDRNNIKKLITADKSANQIRTDRGKIVIQQAQILA